MDIKICGLRRRDAIDAAVAQGAAHTGFIFFETSPRRVEDMSLARDLATIVDQRAKVVPVTVNADDAYLDDIVAAMAPDILQLHGTETPERVEAVKARYDTPVMKALSIKETADFENAKTYIGVADYLLFDAKPAPGDPLPGGNGHTFDWSLLQFWPPNVPYLLSGGLNLDNIVSALTDVRPSGIDLSSGVESAPGVKDVKVLEHFLALVANTNASLSKIQSA